MGLRRAGQAAFAAVVLASTTACAERPQLTLPTDAELAGLYGEGSTVTLNGNVVDVQVNQPADQLRRGGSTWAKVGPFIYLFSPQTQEIFETWSGVGGVRVTTTDGRDSLVARAMLPRATLNSLTWPRALHLVGKARLEGTRRPSYMLDLIEYGEENAEYEYSTRYVQDGG